MFTGAVPVSQMFLGRSIMQAAMWECCHPLDTWMWCFAVSGSRIRMRTVGTCPGGSVGSAVLCGSVIVGAGRRECTECCAVCRELRA